MKIRLSHIDFLKFLAASLVILGHSYGLAHMPEPLYQLSHYDTFGSLAVKIFSFLSGYLVIRSWIRRPELRYYVKKRFIRLFPALLITAFFCAFVIGPIATILSPLNYFSNIHTYLYLLTAFFIPIKTLPGVFTTNPVPFIVNGTLWYIQAIFLLYLSIPVLSKLHLFELKNKKYFIIFLIFLLFVNQFFINKIIFSIDFNILHNLFNAILFFYIGIFLKLYKNIFHINIYLLILIFIFSIVFKIELLNIFSLALIINFFVNNFHNIYLFKYFSKYEISYYMILVSYPVQQFYISKLFDYDYLIKYNFIILYPMIIIALMCIKIINKKRLNRKLIEKYN